MDGVAGQAVQGIANNPLYFLVPHPLPELGKFRPTKGEAGDKIEVEGDGFKKDATKVWIYFSSQEADEGDEIDDEVDVYKLVKKRTPDVQGKLDTYFYLPEVLDEGDKGEGDPEDVVAGYYYIYVTYENKDDIVAVAEFTVRGIELNPVEGAVGTEVEIDGYGFTGRRDITVEYDGDDIDIISGDDETNRSGDFDGTTIEIPESAAGEHTITVTVSSDKASAIFTVKPGIIVKPTSGVAGDSVTVSGTGFGDEASVNITLGDVKVAADEADEHGSFSATFSVPDVGAGTLDIKAKDGDGNSAKAKFTVGISTSISVSPVTTQTSPGHVGTDVTVSGTGFNASSTITITYATAPVVVATTISDVSGNFVATFKVPKSEAGEHIITASDGTNTEQSTFFMEAIPSPTPILLLPEVDSKAEARVLFDWESVTDPSGVTYTLQVSTSRSFSPSFSIVMEKTELAESEYTLTKAEELESTKKDEPYYWRVKAIDGASNESGWSSAGSFYVGFVFAVPDWAKYLLWALGGLLLFFIGFVIGRKTVAYYL